MYILVIETAMHHPFIAVIKEGDVLHYTPLPEKRPLASALIQSMQELSEKFPIDRIAAGIGPGSYTGARVGAVAAEHYAYAKNLPLIPFSSLLPYLNDDTPVYLEGKGEIFFIQEAKAPFKAYRASHPEGSVATDLNLVMLSKNLNYQTHSPKLDLVYLHEMS